MKFRVTGEDTEQFTAQCTIHPKRIPAHRKIKDFLEAGGPREAAARILEALGAYLELDRVDRAGRVPVHSATRVPGHRVRRTQGKRKASRLGSAAEE